MGLWRNDATGDTFDDGLKLLPGEDGFTRDLALAHFDGADFSFVGTPNWAPPPEPASTTEADANAEG